MRQGETTKINQEDLPQKDLERFIQELQELRMEAHHKVYQLVTMMKLADAVALDTEALEAIDVIEVCSILKPIVTGVDEDLNNLDSKLHQMTRAIENPIAWQVVHTQR